MSSCCCHLLKDPLENFSQVLVRCEATKPEVFGTLEKIHVDSMLWLEIYRCWNCGTLFAQEFPFSEAHGGGPRCLYQINATNIDDWIKSYVPLTPQLRQKAEDIEFINNLGEESGPERCRHKGCGRLRIHNGVMCRQHHFEMLKGRTLNSGGQEFIKAT